MADKLLLRLPGEGLLVALVVPHLVQAYSLPWLLEAKSWSSQVAITGILDIKASCSNKHLLVSLLDGPVGHIARLLPPSVVPGQAQAHQHSPSAAYMTRFQSMSVPSE